MTGTAAKPLARSGATSGTGTSSGGGGGGSTIGGSSSGMGRAAAGLPGWRHLRERLSKRDGGRAGQCAGDVGGAAAGHGKAHRHRGALQCIAAGTALTGGSERRCGGQRGAGEALHAASRRNEDRR